MKSIVKALGLSILLHFLFMMGVALFVALPGSRSINETIEVTLEPEQKNELNDSKKIEKQIVREALAPEKLKVPDDETLARFLSQNKQRVKEETKAAASGLTENKSNNKGSNQPQEKKIQQQTPQPNQHDKDGYRQVDITKDLQEMNQLDRGISTSGNSLPTDVRVGSFTALNTDRYLFYSFYARIEELIRFRWETGVTHAINNFDRATAISAGDKNWNTELEFLLDRNGVLVKAMIMKSSGMKSFDTAAIDAFKEARIFPNPPAEMIQQDGFIHLKFAFDVKYPTPALVNAE